MGKYSADTFLKACGAPRSELRLHVRPGGELESGGYVLWQPFAIVGRDPRADVVLSDERVSPFHAYLQVIGGRLFCVDLGSETRVSWPGGPQPSGWLGPDSPIEVGPFAIQVLRPLPGEPVEIGRLPAYHDPLSSRFEGAENLPAASLEFPDEPEGTPLWPLGRTLILVGRDRTCKARLRSATVAPFHCSIVRTSRGIWVVDLLGRNGITVNGMVVRFARLDDGDELRVGRYRMRLRLGGSATLPALRRPAPPPARRWPEPLGEGSWLPGLPASLDSLSALPAAQRAALADCLMGPLVEQVGQMQQQMLDQFQQAATAMFRMFSAEHRDQISTLREELDQIRQLTAELQDLKAELDRTAAGKDERPDEPAAASSLQSDLPRPETPPPSPAGPPERPPEPALERTAASAGDEIHAMLTRRIAAVERERQGRWQKLMDLVAGRPG